MRDALLRHLRRRLPEISRDLAHECGRATLIELAARLPEHDRQALFDACEVADAIPPTSSERGTEDAVYADVARRLGETPLRAREITRTVVSALPRVVDDALKKRLAEFLPETLAILVYQPGILRGEPHVAQVAPDPSDEAPASAVSEEPLVAPRGPSDIGSRPEAVAMSMTSIDEPPLGE